MAKSEATGSDEVTSPNLLSADGTDAASDVITRRQLLKAGLGLGASGVLLGAYGGLAPSAKGALARLADASSRPTLRIALAGPPGYFQVTEALIFKQLVEKQTSGQVIVNVYPAAALAGEADAVKGMQLGTISGYIGTSGSASTVVPQLGILDLPYLFDSQKHYARVMAGSLGTSLAADLEQQGIHLLAWWTGGVRDLINNGHPVFYPADLKGMKIRTLQSSVMIATWQAFGAQPIALPASDMYLALKTGTVDGIESGLAANENLFPVSKYISLTHHGFTPAIFAVSKKWWDGLTVHDKSIIEAAAQSLTPKELAADAIGHKQALALAEGSSMDIVHPDLLAFRKIAAKSWPQFAAPIGGMGLVNKIRAQA